MGDREISELEPSYFELQAYWGITRRMGGLKATEELVELCRINEGKYVLEVGCGVGRTSCHLAKRHGCKVVGVDISERMIDWSNKRARRESVEDTVHFRVADAQNLPFEDTLFDAVICESVTAFVEDKQRAISEYVRVTKSGGYVGLNECTWIKAPPSIELVEYMYRVMGRPEFLTSDGWKELLAGSGLADIVVRTYKVNALSQWINEIRGLDLRDYVGAWYRFLSSYVNSSATRKYLRETWPSRRELVQLLNVFKYFGYVICVGRK